MSSTRYDIEHGAASAWRSWSTAQLKYGAVTAHAIGNLLFTLKTLHILTDWCARTQMVPFLPHHPPFCVARHANVYPPTAFVAYLSLFAQVAFVMNNGKSVIFLAKRRMDSVHDQFKCHGFETSSSQ